MEEAIINEEVDEQLIKKLKSKRRIRGLLIGVNFALFSYLLYSIGTSVVDLVKSSHKIEGIVAICDKNQKDSLKIYSSFVSKKTYDCDFAIYGDYIYFTPNNFNRNNLESINNVQLVKLNSDADIVVKDSLRYKNISNSLNYGVNLFYDSTDTDTILEQGDYVFYHDYVDLKNKGETIKVVNNMDMKYEMYSLPINGKRIKTTIYSYKNNPALVMNITYVTDLPSDYYDVVIVGEHSLDYDFKDLKVLKLEEMDENKLFDINARNVIVNMTNENLEDKYKITTYTLIDDQYSKSDERVFLALAGYAKSEGYATEFNNEHYIGKMTYLIEWKN